MLGVLVITSEYGSGMIRTTFSTVPQRPTVLAAKVTVFAGVTLAVTAASWLIAFFLGQAILSGKGIGVSIGSPDALRTVVGTVLHLTVLGLLSLGIGAPLRKTAGAVTGICGMIFVLPVLSLLLPSSMNVLQKYLPSNPARRSSPAAMPAAPPRCRRGSASVCSAFMRSSPSPPQLQHRSPGTPEPPPRGVTSRRCS